MLAWYIDNLSPFILRFSENIGLRWYGLAYVLAFFCGYGVYRWLALRGYSQLAPGQVGDFITGAAIFGVMLGGRLGYILFYRLDDYLQHPLNAFKLWEGGMSSHGGIIGLILFTLYYARRHSLSWPGLGDNLVVVAPIGLFFGRCANFINGELYGRPTTSSWAMLFPKEMLENASIQDRAIRASLPLDPSLTDPDRIIAAARHEPAVAAALQHVLTPRYPSPLLEAFLEGLVLFAILWFLRTKTRQPRGVLTGVFFIVYAIGRILAENFREPDAPLTGPFTRGQFLSLFLILIGIAFLLYGFKTRRYERVFDSPSSPSGAAGR